MATQVVLVRKGGSTGVWPSPAWSDQPRSPSFEATGLRMTAASSRRAKRDAPRARARRARSRDRRQPAGRLRADRRARRDRRRGLAPRRRHPARRGRRAVDRWPMRAGLTAVVTLEPCNHTGRTGPCSDGPHRRRRRARHLLDRRPQPAARAAAPSACAAAGVEVVGGVLADETDELIHPWLTATRLSRPFVTVKWAVEPRRPRGRGRRHEPVDHRHRRPPARARAPRPRRRDRRRHRHRARRRPLADRARRRRRAAGAPADPGRASALRAGAGGRATASAPGRADRDGEPGSRGGAGRAVSARHPSGLRRGRTDVASAFIAAGLVDEYLVYLAPTIIGGPRLAVGDIGVGTIGDQRTLTHHGRRPPRRRHSHHRTTHTEARS